MHNQGKLQQLDYVQAPNGARLQASAIDGIFAAALSKFATVLLGSVIQGDFEVLASIIVTVLYYAYPLTLNGQTIGKKIYGLKVLPFEDTRTLNFKEALMRETVGKALSYLTMFAGFFMILWRDDRRGLHDLISKTVVVQEAAVAERSKSFIGGAVKSFVVSSFLTAATLSYFYYSSFIADRLEAQLTAQGIKILDISGNLAKGFKVSGFEITNENGRMTFPLIEIGFSDYLKIFTEQTLTFGFIKFSEAEMAINEGTGESVLIGLLALPFVKSVDEGTPEPTEKTPQFKKVIIKNLSANNSKIVDPNKTLEIQLVQLNEFSFNIKTKNTSWKKLAIRSTLAELDTNEVKFHDGDVDLTSPITAKIFKVPGLDLRQPIDLIASLSLTKGKIARLQINALSNKITFTAQEGQDYQIWVSSLSIGDFLDGIPLDQISFYSSKATPFELLTAAPQTASFVIGSGQFVYRQHSGSSTEPASLFSALLGSRVEAYHQTQDGQYVLKLPPGFLSTLVMGGGKLELSSNQNLSPEEILYRLGAKNAVTISKYFIGAPARIPASTEPQ